MHLEGISRQTSHTNGQPNGSSSTMAKRVMTNGFNHANGSTNGNMAERDGYHGNRTDEVVRLVTQALRDLGYENAANMLVQESGHDLESPSVAAFRNAVLNGEWPEAEALLLGSDDQVGFDQPPTHNGLPLKEGVLPRDLRFAIRKQKYLELLEQHDAGSALMVLRQELTPLHTDVDSLHMLSGLILCPTAEDLRLQASWPGSGPASRKQLLADLSNAIHHSVIVPPHRLAELLGQVRQHQIERCLWHNPVEPSSLFVDHMCDKAQFPIQTVQVLKQMEEIWNLEFSHDGRYLAACGQDHLVYIWDLQASIIGEVRWELKGHTKPVVYASWSPDDSMLVTCSQDATARLWDMETGKCIATVRHRIQEQGEPDMEEPVTAAAWTPDGTHFVTGCLDIKKPLNLWSPQVLLTESNTHANQTSSSRRSSSNRRTSQQSTPLQHVPTFHFPATHRVHDLSISPDGNYLVTIGDKVKVFVYSLVTRTLEYSLAFKPDLTCVSISGNGRYMLINLANCEIQLLELATGEFIQKYVGQQQGQYIIRSTFGGADGNLIISGSQDGKIYVFHKERGTRIEVLDGHTHGCVNAVAWNSADACMFASAGDDKTIRIWSKKGNYTPSSSRRTSSELSLSYSATSNPNMQASSFSTSQHRDRDFSVAVQAIGPPPPYGPGSGIIGTGRIL